MNLERHWPYILQVAASRLQNNKTSRHISEFGDTIEIMGAAGELAARIFLGVPLEMNTHFDHGVDIYYGNYQIDVKATKISPGVAFKFLQWPVPKPVKADIVLMTVVNMNTKHATIIGYATREDVLLARINNERQYPCMEIPFAKLRPAWELVAESEIGGVCRIVGSLADR